MQLKINEEHPIFSRYLSRDRMCLEWERVRLRRLSSFTFIFEIDLNCSHLRLRVAICVASLSLNH